MTCQQVSCGICGAIRSDEVHEMNFVVKWKWFRFCCVQSAKVRDTRGFCVGDARDSSETLWTDVFNLDYLEIFT